MLPYEQVIPVASQRHRIHFRSVKYITAMTKGTLALITQLVSDRNGMDCTEINTTQLSRGRVYEPLAKRAASVAALEPVVDTSL